MKDKKIKAIKISAIIIGILLVLSLVFSILFNQFFAVDKDNDQSFKHLISEDPILGSIVFLGASILQVVVAFVPGELLEQVGGLMFGPWWGALLCLIGNLAGSVLVLLLVHKFGRPLVFSIYPQEKFERIAFLRNEKDRDVLTVLLFFIPGTPKDLLTYMLGLTNMSIPKYLLLTSFSRIPSILMSTVSGSWIAEMFDGGDKWRVVLWNVAAIVICAIGYAVYLSIAHRHRKNVAKAALENKDNDDRN